MADNGKQRSSKHPTQPIVRHGEPSDGSRSGEAGRPKSPDSHKDVLPQGAVRPPLDGADTDDKSARRKTGSFVMDKNVGHFG